MRKLSIILSFAIILQACVDVNSQCTANTTFQCGLATNTYDIDGDVATNSPAAIGAAVGDRSYVKCVGTTAPATLLTLYFTCPTGTACISSAKTGLPGTAVTVGTAPAPEYNGPCIILPTCTAADRGRSIGVGSRACDMYYTCGNEETPVRSASALLCATGEHFSATTRTCVPAAQAGCDPSLASSPATQSSSAATESSSASNGSSTAATESSSASNGSSTAPTGPSTAPTGPSTAPTGASTAPTGPSTAPTGPSTGPSSPTPSTPQPTLPPPTCDGPARLADPNSCRHFYRCGAFGRRVRVRCLFRSRFDEEAGRCRPRNVNCGTRPLLN